MADVNNANRIVGVCLSTLWTPYVGEEEKVVAVRGRREEGRKGRVKRRMGQDGIGKDKEIVI